MQKKVFTQQNLKKQLIRLAFTAVFTALAVVIKSFTNLALNIPGTGIRIGLSGIFTFFPAAFCGPVYGGLASGLADLLGCLISPTGAYIPWLTLTAFCGGVIKGLLWMLLTKKAAKKVRIILVSVFAVIGIFGAAVNISLCADGIMTGMVAQEKTLPLKVETEKMNLSPLSKMVVWLDNKTGDSVILTEQTGNKLYAYYKCVGQNETVIKEIKKINEGLLENCEGELYIPKTYKTIVDDAGANKDKVTLIKGVEGSAAQEYAEKIGIPFEPTDVEELTADENTKDAKFKENYRNSLANNINSIVFGFEITGLIGIIFIVLNIIFSKVDKGAEGQSRILGIIRIAAATITSGLIVTIANSFILKAYAYYPNKTLLILIIVRVVEEIISCTVQAYIISLLFGAIYRGKIKQLIDRLQPEVKKLPEEQKET